MGATALADPIYTAIDLGTGSPTYGVDSSGNGTITGSNGLTYTFNPVQNYLPAQWNNTTQGVPIVQPARFPSPYDYGNPNNDFSYSNLTYMNSQGLAAGINQYGVAGHQANGEAFLTQQQANGSWGAPIPLWSGAQSFFGAGAIMVGILGVSPNGQVLGYGVENPAEPSRILYLYDTKTQALTNLTSLINSMTWTNSTQLPMGQSPNWSLSPMSISQFDNQGRILVQAFQGWFGGGGETTPHSLLLIPEGVSADPVAVPEPANWAVFGDSSLISTAVLTQTTV